jgi:hypothetical protein
VSERRSVWGLTYGLILDLLSLAALESNAVTLVLQALGSDQTLDAGSLGIRPLALALGLDLAANDVLADLSAEEEFHISLHITSQTLPPPPPGSALVGDDCSATELNTYIVILAEAEEPADLRGALGAKALGLNGVGQAGDILLALLDDGESENREIGADDTATDGLALALTSAARAVARVSIGEEEADTGRGDDTLLHGETLLVAGDADDIALPLIAEGVSRDLSAHLFSLSVSVGRGSVGGRGQTYALPRKESQSLLDTAQGLGYILVEVAHLALILNIDELLRAVRRVRNVQLAAKVSCRSQKHGTSPRSSSEPPHSECNQRRGHSLSHLHFGGGC